MKETFERNDCGRAEQLLGYLYNDSAAAERADFGRHLRDCAACREELAAFTRVRSSVSDLRAELLQTAPSLSLEEFVTKAGAPPPAVVESRASARAAWAALREFFRLSPAWLRAATVAATLALCSLALMAVANAEVSFGDERFALRTGVRPGSTPPTSIQATPDAQSGESAALRARLKSLAEERDAAVRELEETREQLDDSRAAGLVAAEFETGPSGAPQGSPSTREERRQRRAASAPPKSATPPRATRRTNDDEDLPRLLDLLGDAN